MGNFLTPLKAIVFLEKESLKRMVVTQKEKNRNEKEYPEYLNSDASGTASSGSLSRQNHKRR